MSDPHDQEQSKRYVYLCVQHCKAGSLNSHKEVMG